MSSAPEAISRYEIWTHTLGWLWSLKGLLSTLGCVVSLCLAPRVISQAINNEPVEVTAQTIASVADGSVVRLRARIDPQDAITLEHPLLKNRYLSPIPGTQQSVLAYHDGSLNSASPSADTEICGVVYKSPLPGKKIHGFRVEAREALKSRGLTLPKDHYIISHGEIPRLNLFLIGFYLVILLCLLYIVHKVRKAIYYVKHPDAFRERYAEQVETP